MALIICPISYDSIHQADRSMFVKIVTNILS